MSGDLQRRLIKGVLAKGFGHGSLIIIRLAEVPLFIYFWGAELYGEWLILAALPTYLSMSDFGFAGAAARQVTMLVSKGEQNEALSVFQSISLFISGLFILLAILLVFVLLLLPIDELFGLTHIDPITFVVIAALLSLSSAIFIQMKLLLGVYNSMQQYPLGFLFITNTLIGQFALMAGAIAMDASPLTVAAVMMLTQAFGLVLMRMRLSVLAPWLSYGTSGFSRKTISSLARPSFAGMAMPLGQVVTHSGTRLIIGAVFGPVAVVLFVTHRQLARLVTFVGTFAQPFEVELSRTYGTGDLADFREIAHRTVQVLLWGLLIATIVSLIISAPIYRVWLGGQMNFEATLFGILLVVSFLEGLWIVAFAPVIATNKHIKPAKVYALVSFVLLPIIYIACKSSGLHTVAIALIAMELIMLIVVVRSLLALSGEKLWGWMTSISKFPWFVQREQ